MIEVFILVFCLCLCAFSKRLGNSIQQSEYERQRFALLVAQELDRLQKQVDENRARIMEAEEEILAEPQAKWWGRN